MICEAILKIKADAQVSVSGDNIDTCVFDWLDGNPTNITRAKIKAKLTADQYKKDRAIAYPSIQDQMDMQYKDLLNDTTTWKDAVAKVKTDNPKG